MFIGILDQLNSTELLIGLGVFFIAQTVFFRYMFGRLNADQADPRDHASDQESEILGDQPVRSAVGTPRPRRLQPSPRSGGFEPASEDKDKMPATVPVAEISSVKTDLPVGKEIDPYAPIPLVASEKPAPAPVEMVPVPILASLTKRDPEPEKIASNAKPAAEVKTPEPMVAASSEPPASKTPADKISLPPLSIEAPSPLVPPTPVPVPSMPADSLIQTPETKPSAIPVEDAKIPVESRKEEEAVEPVPASPVPPAPAPVESVPVTAIPRRFFVNPFAKSAAPAEAKAEPKPEEALAIPVSTAPESAPVVPAIEPVGDGIVAVSGPTPLEPATEAPVAAETDESDDVKKRKTPKPAPERTGLILIPPVTASVEAVAPSDKPAETTAPTEAKVGPPPGALTLSSTPAAKVEPAPVPTTPVPPATKLVGRPRIFLPANVPASAAPKEEVAAEKPPTEPVVSPETVEAKETPLVPEDKPEAKSETEVESKTVEPAPETKPEELPVAAESKPAPEPEKVEEPETEEKRVVAEEVKPEEEPVAVEPPSAAIPVPEPEAPTTPAPVDPVAAVPLAAEPPSVPPALPEAAKSGEKAPEPEISTPPPIPMLTKTISAPAATPEGSLSLASTAPAQPITTPEPAMPSTDTTTNSSASGRASAQLTLGFEITSLQLTPFFKLGAVQLRPLSNVVSLHLIGAQPENPLAAGISFQIDRVELDGSHIKAIHLKLLGGAQAAATPQPKLQVNSVELSRGSEGAPISITPSDQTSTAVQLLATFTIAAMDFTPSFEIGSLRLEPTSNQVMLRLAPSSRPAALDLPPAFDISTVQLGGDAQIAAVALTPSTAKAS